MLSIYVINKVLDKTVPGLFINAKSVGQMLIGGFSKIIFENMMIGSELIVMGGLVGAYLWTKNKKKSNNNLEDDLSTSKKGKVGEKVLGFLVNGLTYIWIVPVVRTILSVKNKNLKILKFL